MRVRSINYSIVLIITLVQMTFSTEILTNHEFVSGMSGWEKEGDGFSVTPGSDEYGSYLDVSISDGGSDSWDVKLFQDGLSFREGYEYSITWGASRESGNILVGIGYGEGETFTALAEDKIYFSGDYLDHTFANGTNVTYHHCAASVSGGRFYMDMGGSNANARLAWASVDEVAKSCTGTTTSGTTTSGTTTSGTTGDLTNPGVGPVSYYGELKASGNRLMGSRSNTVVQVRGMSLYWSIWGGEFFYNEKAINYLIDDWKIEIIRAAMAVEETGGYTARARTQRLTVETVVDAAIAKDIYVIIDFHSHAAESYTTESIEFFGYMAEKYGANDHVIFEIYNEPIYTSWTSIKSYANSVIQEIRKYSDNLVIVGTRMWSTELGDPASNPISDANVAYAVHFYAGTHGSNNRSKANIALNANLPVFASEWGTVDFDGDGSPNTTESNSWMSWMDQNKISWCNWSAVSIDEGASAFLPSVGAYDDLGNTANMTTSGKYVYGKLTGYAASAVWRSAPTEEADIVRQIGNNNGLSFQLLDNNEIYYNQPEAVKHSIKMYDIVGNKIVDINRDATSKSNSFKLPELVQGIYFIRYNSELGIYSTKIIIN